MVQIIQGGCEEYEEEWRMYGEYKEYENNIKKKKVNKVRKIWWGIKMWGIYEEYNESIKNVRRIRRMWREYK